MRRSAGLAGLLACFALETAALGVDTCSYSVQPQPGFQCPLSFGATACVSASSITGACQRPLRCYGGKPFLCNLTLIPKSGPAPQCPAGSIRLERLGLHCSRESLPGAFRTATPTHTPTPTVPFPCPDLDATPTPGLPPPAPGDDSFVPGPCTNHESREAGTLPGSVVILPKVVADGGRDTAVQLTNRSNLPASILCVYVNGRLLDPTQPPGPTNPPLLQTTDFILRLTPQQPTQWTVSSGRLAATAPNDPGPIPPPPAPFVGELKCMQVDDAMFPFPANSLTASATLLGPARDISKYDAITLVGDPDGNDSDTVFDLDDVEFSACPARLYFNVVADGAQSPVLGAGSSVSNRLTLVPCRQDFAQQQFAQVPVLAESRDEFELLLSAAFLVNGFLDIDLRDLSTAFASIGESFRQVRLQAAGATRCAGGSNNAAPCTSDAGCPGGRCLPNSPIVGVIESTHRDGMGRSARAAQALHSCGSNPNAAIAPPPQP